MEIYWNQLLYVTVPKSLNLAVSPTDSTATQNMNSHVRNSWLLDVRLIKQAKHGQVYQ